MNDFVKNLCAWFGTIWTAVTLDQLVALCTLFYTTLMIIGWFYDRFFKSK